jgi:F0F1-type ATP synthase assembly protein I
VIFFTKSGSVFGYNAGMPSTSPASRRPESTDDETRLGWRMAGLAFVMSSEAAAGAGIGWLIDHFAGTGTRWLLIGAIVGIAVGMLSFIKGALALNRLLTQQERERKARGIPLPPPLPDEPEEDDGEPDDDWPESTRPNP